MYPGITNSSPCASSDQRRESHGRTVVASCMFGSEHRLRLPGETAAWRAPHATRAIAECVATYGMWGPMGPASESRIAARGSATQLHQRGSAPYPEGKRHAS